MKKCKNKTLTDFDVVKLIKSNLILMTSAIALYCKAIRHVVKLQDTEISIASHSPTKVFIIQ